jgi:3-hydroxyisobutyrate dehydrogenase-like beta-hydroxyacid dehydrogenase
VGDSLTVGFIGLGDQGAPIARRIAGAGWPLRLWARRPETLIPFTGSGAELAESPLALGAACDVVGICVVNDDDARQVVLGDGAGVLFGMKPGGVIAIHSTLLPDTVADLARIAEARGVAVLDAPVSGGARGAEAGTMTVMVGGDAAALALARPVFESFATTIAHLGPVGAGQMVKLLNNNLCYANVALGLHALDLAEQLGMDRAVAADMIKVSSGASTGFNIIIDEQMLRKISGGGGNLPKDVAHFAEVLADRGVAANPLTTLSGAAAGLLQAFVKRGAASPGG